MNSRGTYAQKKAVFFDQFQAVGLTIYGVSTLHAIPTTLLLGRIQYTFPRIIGIRQYLLCISTQSHTLDQQPSRWNFTDKRVRDGSNGTLIDNCPAQHETTGSVCGAGGGARRSQAEETDDEQHDEKTAETV